MSTQTVDSPTPAETTIHVSGPRPTPSQFARQVLDIAGALPWFASAPLLRRWHRRWGATDAEVAAPMPGDDLVPGCQCRVTRAITIGVSPPIVWKWLVQTGFGRAGFYSNDLLDNAGHPSANHIVEELQDPRIGDWVPMFSKVNDTTAFRFAAIDRPRELLWIKPDSTWAWRLTPTPEGGTRLVTRLRVLYRGTARSTRCSRSSSVNSATSR
jgi:hypothetical protein